MTISRIHEIDVIEQPTNNRLFNEVMGRRFDMDTGTRFITIEIANLLRGITRVIELVKSEAMLSLAAENAVVRGVSGFVSWRVGDARNMPFETDKFDLDVSSGSLHHWDEPSLVFGEIARMLKPGGCCLARFNAPAQTRRMPVWLANQLEPPGRFPQALLGFNPLIVHSR